MYVKNYDIEVVRVTKAKPAVKTASLRDLMPKMTLGFDPAIRSGSAVTAITRLRYDKMEARVAAHMFSGSVMPPTVSTSKALDYGLLMNQRRWAKEMEYHNTYAGGFDTHLFDQRLRAGIERARYYFNPLKAPLCVDYPPDARALMIWGPQGEWTGIPFVHTHNEFRTHGRDEIMLRDGPFHGVRFRGIHDPRYHPAYDPRAYHPRDVQHGIFHFHDYEDQMRYTSVLGHQGSLTTHAIKLGSALLVIRAAAYNVEEWGQTLKAHANVGAVLALRDEHGFDPMGVLADIHDADWVYDEREEAFTVDGEAYRLKAPFILGALGSASTDARSQQWALKVQDLIAKLYDDGGTRDEIGKIVIQAASFYEHLISTAERHGMGNKVKGGPFDDLTESFVVRGRPFV